MFTLTSFGMLFSSLKVFWLTSYLYFRAVMLIYDLLLTISDEVELIWLRKHKCNLVTALWIFVSPRRKLLQSCLMPGRFSFVSQNRYLWPFAYIVIIVCKCSNHADSFSLTIRAAFHDPGWNEYACSRFILYPQIIRLVVAVIIGSEYPSHYS